MNNHNLNENNYFSPENNMKYMSCSQFKAFMKCEASALAELRGEYTRPMTDALLIGSYVDAFFEGTFDNFKEHHPEVFKKDGTLKAQYLHAEYVIERVLRDRKFMQYMGGEKQKIFVGKIAKVPFKIKVDSLHPFCIVDLKYVKDFKPVWDEESLCKKDFISYWGYDVQGAIYQEIIRQNYGKSLPFYIAAVTKEAEPDLDIFHIDDDTLNVRLGQVKSLAQRFQKIKEGKLEPQRCGECAYCRKTKVIQAPKSFRELQEVYEVE